jgi:hypothetical protein
MVNKYPNWSDLSLDKLEEMVINSRKQAASRNSLQADIEVIFDGELLQNSNMVLLAPNLYGVLKRVLKPGNPITPSELLLTVSAVAVENFIRESRQREIKKNDIVRPLRGKWKIATGRVVEVSGRWIYILFNTLEGEEVVKIAMGNLVKTL